MIDFSLIRILGRVNLSRRVQWEFAWGIWSPELDGILPRLRAGGSELG